MEQLPSLRESPSPSSEEDRRGLVLQNSQPFDIDRKLLLASLGDLGNKKRYLLMVFVPLLLLVIVYFSVDLRRGSSVWDVNIAASSEIRRESELRALYLLREQQLGLLNLLKMVRPNYTVGGGVHSTNNNVSLEARTRYFVDAKAKILDQISINNQVQKLVLSTHNHSTVSTSTLEGVNLCNKMNAGVSERRTIEWIPRSDNYLFAICVSGQMSNHLMCLEKHMFFAAVLKRILVIPSHRVDYQYSRVLDIEHINQCLGRKVAVTFEEFTKKLKRKEMRINKFICYFPNCHMDEEHVRKLKSLGLSLPKLESPWADDVRKPKKRTILDLQAKFSSNDKVIAIGDVFFADVERGWVMQPGGPIAHKCKTLVEPSRLIVLTAQRFVQTFLGSRYVALHLRRRGFLKFCNMKTPSCFFPVPQAANCIRRVVEMSNAQVIYLSTDAAESETGVLQSLIAVDGKHVPLVKRPPRNSAEKWDSLLYRHGLHDDSLVEAMLDKTISAMSSVFIGSSGSTFTEDILRLRKDWGSASSCDEYICQGELPNFIADNE